MNDTISRQAAIRWVKTECNPYGKPTLDFESGKRVIEHLNQLPSADRKGHWLDGRGKPAECFHDVYCSECGEMSEYRSSFCPDCGADMRGEEE